MWSRALPLLCLSPTGRPLRRLSVRWTRNKIREADRAEPVPAGGGGSVLTLVENLDRTLTVDGEPVSTEVGKDTAQRNDLCGFGPHG